MGIRPYNCDAIKSVCVIGVHINTNDPDTILALQRRFTYGVCAELWRLSFGVIRVNYILEVSYQWLKMKSVTGSNP